MGTDRVFAAELQALRPHSARRCRRPNLPAVLAAVGRDGQPPRGHATASRTPTPCDAPRRCTARRATPSSTPPTIAGRELASAVDNPVVVGDEGRVQRKLPRGAGRLRPRLPRDRRGRRRLDQRAPHRPVPRQGPQPRPAAVPGGRPRRRQRPHDRAVHPGRHRLGDEAAGGPGIRRLDPVQRDAGGPRVDGLERRPQAAPLGRRPVPRGRRSRLLTAARALDLRRPLEPAAGTGAVVDLLRANGIEGPGPDRHLSPEIETTVSLVQSGAVLAAVESKIGELQ